MAQITLWLDEKLINRLLEAFCFPINFKVQSQIKPEDLEEFKPNSFVKEENNPNDEFNHLKLESLEQKDSDSISLKS